MFALDERVTPPPPTTYHQTFTSSRPGPHRAEVASRSTAFLNATPFFFSALLFSTVFPWLSLSFHCSIDLIFTTSYAVPLFRRLRCVGALLFLSLFLSTISNKFIF